MTSSGFKGMANRSQLWTQALIIRFKFVETTRGFLFFYTCLALFGCSLEEKIYFHPVTLTLSCRGSHTHSEQHCRVSEVPQWLLQGNERPQPLHWLQASMTIPETGKNWWDLMPGLLVTCPGVTGASPLEGALDSSSFNTFSLEFLRRYSPFLSVYVTSFSHCWDKNAW